MNEITKKLHVFAKNNLNVLLVGSHGIGKSSIVKSIADELNINFKYYSSSTLDPFADIVGIPAPDKETNTLNYYRPKDLEEAEFVFFDELNRAHPRVLNAVLEIIQFKTVNGKKLPKLKMVWAAINPPGDNYQVEEMDPALVDRFHCFIKMQAEIDLEYLSTKMRPEVASLIKIWWDTTLSEHQRKIFTPRRAEYVGVMVDKELPWKDSMPQGHPFPIDELEKRIKLFRTGKADDELTVSKENVLANVKHFIDKTKENPKLFTLLADIVARFDDEDFYKAIDLTETFPQDLLTSFLGQKFPIRKNQTKAFLQTKGIDLKKYPKICKAFKWD